MKNILISLKYSKQKTIIAYHFTIERMLIFICKNKFVSPKDTS